MSFCMVRAVWFDKLTTRVVGWLHANRERRGI